MPRKKGARRARVEPPRGRFNEAGALCPGKRACFTNTGKEREGFNEAGALCPGKRTRRADQGRRAARFNEAGALCPGKRITGPRTAEKDSWLQ